LLTTAHIFSQGAKRKNKDPRLLASVLQRIWYFNDPYENAPNTTSALCRGSVSSIWGVSPWNLCL